MRKLKDSNRCRRAKFVRYVDVPRTLTQMEGRRIHVSKRRLCVCDYPRRRRSSRVCIDCGGMVPRRGDPYE